MQNLFCVFKTSRTIFLNFYMWVWLTFYTTPRLISYENIHDTLRRVLKYYAHVRWESAFHRMLCGSTWKCSFSNNIWHLSGERQMLADKVLFEMCVGKILANFRRKSHCATILRMQKTLKISSQPTVAKVLNVENAKVFKFNMQIEEIKTV